MTYDEGLAHRIRTRLEDRDDLAESEMFGGLGFMIGGNMCCGVHGDAMIARIGPEAYEDALEEPHARPFDFTGRAMRGWVFVDPPGVAEDEALEAWIQRALSFVVTLPAK